MIFCGLVGQKKTTGEPKTNGPPVYVKKAWHDLHINYVLMVYVWLGLTPQQQLGSYHGGEMMRMVSVVEETGVPGGNHRPTASN